MLSAPWMSTAEVVAVAVVLLVQLFVVILGLLWLVWWIVSSRRRGGQQSKEQQQHHHWTGLPVMLVSFAIVTVLLSLMNNTFRTVYLQTVTDVRWLDLFISLDDIILSTVSLLMAFCKIGLLFLFEEIRRNLLASSELEFRHHQHRLRVLFWIVFALTSIFAFFPLMSLIVLATPSNQETPQILIFLFFAITDLVMGSSFLFYGVFLLRSTCSNVRNYVRLSSRQFAPDRHTPPQPDSGDGSNTTTEVEETVQFAYGSINPSPVRNKLPEHIQTAFKSWATWTGPTCIAFGVLSYFLLAAVRALNIIVPPEKETFLLVAEETAFLYLPLFAMITIFEINRRRSWSENVQSSQR